MPIKWKGKTLFALLFCCILAATAWPLEVIVDNDQGAPAYSETGAWNTSGSTGYNGGTYRYATAGGAHTATWTAGLGGGDADIYVIYVAGANRTTSTKYVIHASDGDHTVYINQQENSLVWVYLGTFPMVNGDNSITVDASGSTGGSVVIADAVRFVTTSATQAWLRISIPFRKPSTKPIPSALRSMPGCRLS